MLGLDGPLPVDFDAAFIRKGALSWIARNSSKPGRSGGEAWTVHASPEWSKVHLEAPHAEVTRALTREFFREAGLPEMLPAHAQAHRWRYALPEPPLDSRCLYDPALGIGAAGDWCAGPRVEGAYLSGVAAATALRENRAATI